MQWSVPEGNFWDDEKLQRRLASRLDRWVSLMRMHGGAQAEMIASAPEEIRDLFSKRIKLMAPLLKVWKGALKAEKRCRFFGPYSSGDCDSGERSLYQPVEAYSG
ncbi:DNA helicase IV [Escherichia coli]|uniref:DNA helicase IV n=1 Tax=Escherichia coli TaxID=562 RepID=A0A377DU73_ECOLX|nr:DNA helicase IV [Escherichia coli]